MHGLDCRGIAHTLSRINQMNIQNALKIQGWMSPNELYFLADMAWDCNSIVEVGCYQGRSTRALADNTKGKIYAVDNWNSLCYTDDGQVMYRTDDTTRNIFYANLADKIKDGTVIPFPKEFEDFYFLPGFPDFIFLDANHRYKDVKRDIEMALKFNPKFIGGHDYCIEWPGVIEAVDEMFPKVKKAGESIWWTKLR